MKKIKCTVEIPTHSYYKYEIDKSTFGLIVDRVLTIPYPANYGYVNNTLWDDGDALDVFIIGLPLQPLCVAAVYPFAVVEMYDKGVSDYKLIASFDPPSRQKFTNIHEHIVKFLKYYKKGTVIKSISIREKDIEKTLKRAYNIYD